MVKGKLTDQKKRREGGKGQQFLPSPIPKRNSYVPCIAICLLLEQFESENGKVDTAKKEDSYLLGN